MLYEELTRKIIGAAMKVHSNLGNGFQEVIYQRCMSIELKKSAFDFAREIEMTIFYNGEEVGTRRVEFLVENTLIVELKSIIDLNDIHICQCRNYLEAYNLSVGLLINFGAVRLQYKRIYNTKHPECRKQ